MKEKVKKLKKRFLGNLEASQLPVVSHPKVLKAADNVLTLSFIRYLIIGFASFGLDLGIYNLLNSYSPVKALAANLTSTLITWIFNYTMMNTWTFKSGKSVDPRKMKRYFTLAIFNYIFNNVMFQIFALNLNLNANLVKVAITAMIVCWNFFLYKLWVFKNDEEGQEE